MLKRGYASSLFKAILPMDSTRRHQKRIGLLLLAPLALTTAALVCYGHHYYTQTTFRWFNTDLPSPAEVSQWSEQTKENTLFQLSRWDSFTSGKQFRRFVKAQIRALGLDPSKAFHFLEIGMGVGAFARVVLDLYPEASGEGIDIAPVPIEIAKAVLPSSRMKPAVGDMRHLQAYGGSAFDVVFVPGALCLLSSMDEVRMTVAEIERVLKSTGRFCVSLMPDETSQAGACNTRISKRFWTEEVAYRYHLKLLALEDMDTWHLPHSMGRYHVCMQKQG
jgi:ubiquinone/menaquinone biosynthesis C-methylase UbiE